MFSFFKKKSSGTPLKPVIWMTEEEKFNGLLSIAKQNKEVVFVAWFDGSSENLTTLFTLANLPTTSIFNAKNIRQHDVINKQVLFIEHHPLREKEEEFFLELGLKEVEVHSALTEPFLQLFGGDRIVDLMKRLGYKEGESVSHPMITSSIKKAQDKIKAEIQFEHSAHSQRDWLRRNLAHKFFENGL